MARIGLMGGSFNPIHLGHINLARAALDGGCVDRIYFLPTGNPPHKRDGLADKHDRLAMVQLAVEGETDMYVCREEIDRDGIIYTVDTLERLTESEPENEWVYLIGADTLCQLHTWRRPEDVIRLCRFLVVMRPGEAQADVLTWLDYWRSRGAVIDFLSAREMDISSTDVRRRAERRLSLEGYVPAAVEAYIRQHGLYEAYEETSQ